MLMIEANMKRLKREAEGKGDSEDEEMTRGIKL